MVRTSRPCSARKTPLRPSPSAIESAFWPGLSRCGLALQEGVRLGAEMIARRRKSRFPAFQFRHRVPRLRPARVMDAAPRGKGRRRIQSCLALRANRPADDLSRSERRISASAYSLLSANLSRKRDTTAKSSRDTSANSRSLTRRSSGLTARIASSPFGDSRTSTLRRSRVLACLVSETLADQSADLGGHVGCGELGVVGERADRHAFAALLVGRSDQHDELRGGEAERAAEGFTAGVQPAERQHHQVERFAERDVAAGLQHRRQRDGWRRNECLAARAAGLFGRRELAFLADVSCACPPDRRL